MIAHELAHVFQASTGDLEPAKKASEELNTVFGEYAETIAYHESDCERGADTIAARWGFNVSAFSRWVSEKIDWDELPTDRY